MAKPQIHCSWIEDKFQAKVYQTEIFTGFHLKELSEMTILINSFVESIDLSFFDEYYLSTKNRGGRPNANYRIMLKLYLYAIYNGVSIRKLSTHFALGSDLHYLSLGLGYLPKKSTFSKFLNVIDLYIEEIFYSSITYIETHIKLNKQSLYCDGTVFEAHNSRHKIITDTNLEKSNKKYSAILENEFTDEAAREKALKKLELNRERAAKLALLQRKSYGRTDEDSVILLDKNGSYIAGYNAVFVEESNHGIIVFVHLSNKNPEPEAFKELFPSLINRYKFKEITFDKGFSTVEIITLLEAENISVIAPPRKGEESSKMIPESMFKLSKNEEYLTCPKGRKLYVVVANKNGKTRFKSNNCTNCSYKPDCSDRYKQKSLWINIKEFKLIRKTQKRIKSDYGKDKYLHRLNICESPHGFVFYSLKGKKLRMNGLKRNKTVITMYAILYNLRRLLSVKSD